MKQQSVVHRITIITIITLRRGNLAQSSAGSLVTGIKGWCHNSHNTLVTHTPRLGRGCRLLIAAEEERWPALMRREQRTQEEGNYSSGGAGC